MVTLFLTPGFSVLLLVSLTPECKFSEAWDLLPEVLLVLRTAWGAKAGAQYILVKCLMISLSTKERGLLRISREPVF